MDRFVEKNGPQSYVAATARTAQPQIETPASAYTKPLTETEPNMEVSSALAPSSSIADTQTQHIGAHNTDLIAQAVAALLSPMITASVGKAVSAGMQQLQAQLGQHASGLNEAEHCIANIEEELYQSQSTEQAQDKTNKYILEKLDDLENRSRRSNL